MFDDLRVLYPLPIAQNGDYQTKSTCAQFCDLYELREDGTLWHEAYDGGLGERRINVRWEHEKWTGPLVFYDTIGTDGWIEYCAMMKDGVLQSLTLVEHRLPTR